MIFNLVGAGSKGEGGGGSASPITVTPTGEEFTVEGNFSAVTVEGEVNLKPENIAAGITIYGVTGTVDIESNTDGMPSTYIPFVNEAKELYTGDYEHIFILEENAWISVGFMMADFRVHTYNDETSEFTASGWVHCGYKKETGEWEMHDFKNSTSTGWNYIDNFRYCDTIIEYDDGQTVGG